MLEYDSLGKYYAIDFLIFGGLAQLGEHLPYKQGVAGSSPATSTIRTHFILNVVRDIYLNNQCSFILYRVVEQDFQVMIISAGGAAVCTTSLERKVYKVK